MDLVRALAPVGCLTGAFTAHLGLAEKAEFSGGAFPEERRPNLFGDSVTGC